MRQEIPLLNQVHVEKPCHADWDAMTPVQGEQIKHCAGCKKNVYNLSAMTEQDANTLLEQNPNLCVRYAQDETGKILTQTQRSRVASWLPSMLKFAASVAAIVAGIFGRTAVADTAHPKKAPKKPIKTQTQTTRKLIMGKRAMPTHTMGMPIIPRKNTNPPKETLGKRAVTLQKDESTAPPNPKLDEPKLDAELLRLTPKKKEPFQIGLTQATSAKLSLFKRNFLTREKKTEDSSKKAKVLMGSIGDVF